MDELKVWLLVHGVATLMMVGVIWFIQIVHYPLYKRVKEGFADYERMHLRRSSFILGPIMLTEIVTALFVMGFAPGGVFSKLAAINLIFLILTWIATLLFQIGQHQRLAVRFSTHVHHLLLTTNWIRTMLWTIRGIIVCYMTYSLMS